MTSTSNLVGDIALKDQILSWRESLVVMLASLGITYEWDRLLHGEIQKVQQSFGFILGEDGKEYFFHFRAIRTPLEPGEVILGKPVRFELGANATGVCAINVQIADDTLILNQSWADPKGLGRE